jgi:hypothetical protein
VKDSDSLTSKLRGQGERSNTYLRLRDAYLKDNQSISKPLTHVRVKGDKGKRTKLQIFLNKHFSKFSNYQGQSKRLMLTTLTTKKMSLGTPLSFGIIITDSHSQWLNSWKITKIICNKQTFVTLKHKKRN